MTEPGAINRLLALLALLTAIAGCTSLEGPGYLWQSIGGHLGLMRDARPIDDWLADPATDSRLRRKLEFVVRVRRFASMQLGLPDNGSYTRFVALQRPYVLWNVFAAPRLSLDLRTWCFPVAGCIAYRGYYRKEDAERYAARLAEEGFDTQVGGVPAYSTLGWFDDPVPSTILRFPDTEVARLIFHELAHQVVYLPGDSTFNESFATAVEEFGVQAWLRAQLARDADPLPARQYAEYQAHRHDFLALLQRYRARLAEIYASPQDDAGKLREKASVFAALRVDYAQLRQSWGGFAGYDRWFDRPLGNAHLAAIGTYTDLLPGFRRLIAREGGDLPAFFDAVRELARLPQDERRAALTVESQQGPSASR